jgi:hypothetical protein
MIDAGNNRDDKSIEGGGFNFYDMQDQASIRSRSQNPNDSRSPNNPDFFGYHSSRANIKGQVLSKESIIQLNNFKPQKRSISNENEVSPSYYK